MSWWISSLKKCITLTLRLSVIKIKYFLNMNNKILIKWDNDRIKVGRKFKESYSL